MLVWIESFNGQNPKLLRWKTTLAAYDYEVAYKKGSQNVVADALSRIEPNLNINEDPQKIPVVQQPLNHFNIQIVFRFEKKPSVQITTPFTYKTRRVISEPTYTFDTISNILQSILKPNKMVAIFAPDHIFLLIEEAYNNYFSENDSFRISRCKLFLPEITDSEDQKTRILTYHIKSYHRGIDETFQHLKRDIYFPRMKGIITQVIKTATFVLHLNTIGTPRNQQCNHHLPHQAP